MRLTKSGSYQWLCSGDEVFPALLAAIQNRRGHLLHLTTRQASLEDVFVHLTGRHMREE